MSLGQMQIAFCLFFPQLWGFAITFPKTLKVFDPKQVGGHLESNIFEIQILALVTVHLLHDLHE